MMDKVFMEALRKRTTELYKEGMAKNIPHSILVDKIIDAFLKSAMKHKAGLENIVTLRGVVRGYCDGLKKVLNNG
jgi:hypothetical protein